MSKKFLFIQLLIFLKEEREAFYKLGWDKKTGFTSNCFLHCPFDDYVGFITNFIFQSFIIAINTLDFKEFLWDIM